MKIMLRPASHTRYHIAAILAVHRVQFVAQYKRWIRPVVFENLRKLLACRTPVLGCHIYQCKGCGHLELIPITLIQTLKLCVFDHYFYPVKPFFFCFTGAVIALKLHCVPNIPSFLPRETFFLFHWGHVGGIKSVPLKTA